MGRMDLATPIRCTASPKGLNEDWRRRTGADANSLIKSLAPDCALESPRITDRGKNWPQRRGLSHDMPL